MDIIVFLAIYFGIGALVALAARVREILKGTSGHAGLLISFWPLLIPFGLAWLIAQCGERIAQFIAKRMQSRE